MDKSNLGTIGGKPINQEMLATLSARCERDWAVSEVEEVPTSHGRALAALQALALPVAEIEALERRAQHEKSSLSLFIKSILQGELAG
ncbi:MAG: hypothetical protein FWH32_04455 [Clostridiales bacterium]|nr:hypothetical protein [Clostridiales bacterium]